MMTTKRAVAVSLKLQPEIYEKLREISHATHIPITTLMRIAIYRTLISEPFEIRWPSEKNSEGSELRLGHVSNPREL
jgi:predicted DNA-binding protein